MPFQSKAQSRLMHAAAANPAVAARTGVKPAVASEFVAAGQVLARAGAGGLKLLGHQASQRWAEDLRQSFRHTMLYQLAFWEWIGAVLAFAFLIGSVLMLPVSCGARRKKWGPAPTPAEVGIDSLLRQQRKAP